MANSSRLPPLILGNNSGMYYNDVKRYSDQYAKVIPSIKQFYAIGEDTTFESKTYLMKINNLSMIANASTPVYMNSTEFEEITLVIPFFGENHTYLDEKQFHWIQSRYAVLMPNVSRRGTSSIRSILSINIQPKIILETAQSMLGADTITLADLRLHEPRLIPLSYGGFSFEIAIRKLCLYTDQINSASGLLEKLRIDEQFYRLIVMMFIPEKFFDSSTIMTMNTHDSKSALMTLQEYVSSANHRFLSLSEIEEFTGLTTRTLQLGFKKYFGITPTQWLRERNLEYARKLILDGYGSVSVTQAAMECGFTNFSLFAKYYREQFGELPSETLQRIKLY